MSLLEQIKEKAAQKGKTIVLPEGTEKRTLLAIKDIIANKIAHPILLGNESAIRAAASDAGANISGAEIIDPVNSALFDDFVQAFYEMRKSKGLTLDQAKSSMLNPLFFA